MVLMVNIDIFFFFNIISIWISNQQRENKLATGIAIDKHKIVRYFNAMSSTIIYFFLPWIILQTTDFYEFEIVTME